MMNLNKVINIKSKFDYIFSVILLMFILFRFSDLRLPFFGDEMDVYVKAIHYMYQHSLSILPNSVPSELSRGHPLLFVFIYSLFSKLLGYNIFLVHTISLCFSLGTLWATYLISKRIFSPVIALTSVILLAVQPVFIAHSITALPEIMLAFFSTLSIYFFITRKHILYFIACSCALLTKESAIVLPFAFFTGNLMNDFISTGRIFIKDISKILWIFTPLTVFISFFFIQKNQLGWYFFPLHIELISLYYKDILWRIIQSVNFLFITQGRILWLIPFCILAFKSLKNVYYRKEITVEFQTIVTLMVYCISIVGFASLNFSLHRYLLYVFPPLSIIIIFALQTLISNRKHFYTVYAFFCFTCLFFIRSNTLMFDENLCFKDVVKVNQQGVKYLEDHHLNNVPVFANYQFQDELTKPYMGYLKTEIFTDLYKPYDTLPLSKKTKEVWCIINEPDSFNFKSLPFKVKKEIIFTSSFASTGIYKVIP